MRFGGYEVEGEIARGGMGVVYRARDLRLQRQVAVKVFTAPVESRAARERFDLEMQALARLDHPNVVAIHHADEHEGRPFLVMELVQGRSLRDRIAAEGPLPVREAVELIHALALALEYVHGAGVLHRDLKPANVLLRAADGRPLLTDFGIAKDLTGAQAGISRAGAIIGSPGYMPPEQVGLGGPLGPPADVYGLGATLYAALTGEPPVSGSSLAEVAVATASRPVEPPSRLRPEVDRALDEICQTALAKAPGDRYPTAESFAIALEDWLAQHDRAGSSRLLIALAASAVGLALILASLLVVSATSRRPGAGPDAPPPVASGEAQSLSPPAPPPPTQAEQPTPRSTPVAPPPPKQEDPKVAEIRHRTFLLLRAERYREALASAEAGLKLAPDDGFMLNWRGLCLYFLGRAREALPWFDRALKADPNLADAFHNRGLTHIALKNWDAAIRDANATLELDRRRLWARHNRGYAYLRKQMPKQAIADFSEELVTNGRSGLTYKHRGEAYAMLGNLRAAIRDFDKALRYLPNSSQADITIVKRWREQAMQMVERGKR